MSERIASATMRLMKVSQLTPEQIREMAPLVPTSEATLRQVAHGQRGVTAIKAIAIERAAAKIGLDIRRESMNEGCAACEFAKTCRRAHRMKGKSK